MDSNSVAKDAKSGKNPSDEDSNIPYEREIYRARFGGLINLKAHTARMAASEEHEQRENGHRSGTQHGKRPSGDNRSVLGTDVSKAPVDKRMSRVAKLQHSEPDIPLFAAADDCLATELYIGCLTVLQGLYSQASNSQTSCSNAILQALGEELGRFYLCGEAFGQGSLNRIFEDAEELRNTVLESLSGVGLLLI